MNDEMFKYGVCMYLLGAFCGMTEMFGICWVLLR